MKKPTFSKWMVILITIVFVVSFAVGTAAILLEALGKGGTSALGEYLGFSSGAFATVSGFYLWKAKNENLNKYKPGERGEMNEESEEENG